VLGATAPALALDAIARRAVFRHGAMPAETLFACLVAQRSTAGRAAAAARIGAPRGAVRAAEEAARLLALPADAPDDLESVTATGEHARLAARVLDPGRQRALQFALRRWEGTRAPLSAREVLALGFPQGPALGETLRWLRRERYLGTLDGAADARRMAQERLQRQQMHTSGRARAR
jgi:hypothetical protein